MDDGAALSRANTAVLSTSRLPVFIASDLSGFGFSFPHGSYALPPPPSLWECGNPAQCAGFPSAEGREGNSLFEFSSLSSARHFHSAGGEHFPRLRGADRRPHNDPRH